MKEEVKHLWRTCFEDSEEFIDLYFKEIYTDSITQVAREDEKIVAALQMIPYHMNFHAMTIPVSYISGACTLPEYRNKGIMERLLTQSFQEMYEKEIGLSILIPGEKRLFDYYNKLGYETTFYYSKQQVKADSTHISVNPSYTVSKLTDDEWEKAFGYFSDKEFANYPLNVLHDKEHFNTVIKDVLLSQGEVFLAYSKDRIKGIAFCVPVDNETCMKEMYTDNEEIESALIHAAMNHFNTDTITIVTRATQKPTYPLGMARVINAKMLLDDFMLRHPRLKVNFELIDPLIPANNGYYYLANNECEKKDTPPDAPFITLTASQLIKFLMKGYSSDMPDRFRWFEKQNSYMSLMLD